MRGRFFFLATSIWMVGCQHNSPLMEAAKELTPVDLMAASFRARYVTVASDITMDSYFEAIDTLCSKVNAMYGLAINEYELIHANRWVLDSLVRQDYYLSKEEGRFIYNQRQCTPIHAGDTLHVPTSAELADIRRMLSEVTIDLNIPEYKLRIYVGDSLVRTCMVRVGKNKREFLALAGHDVDLRTPVGDGAIIRVERDPLYINPVDGRRYSATRRDDGRYTALPRIPFLEPSINGRRPGALIHPTTNRSTLGKAVSNGCVGLSEADAWVVYYNAPIGTSVRFRYELDGVDSTGKSYKLKDIYGLSAGDFVSHAHE